ncbi:hypothetical protein KIN20_028400 [Parelaphostrongylus tenuis]|uniref:Uncharacterized protein n=1 Tax=Parelaphostrongylus tenuis TaxID=148309 RepID=A0AAD5R0R8_PARTN|nr:hypothetical protein KIN20_028400 [Parelaphostrongylus tenuis]
MEKVFVGGGSWKGRIKRGKRGYGGECRSGGGMGEEKWEKRKDKNGGKVTDFVRHEVNEFRFPKYLVVDRIMSGKYENNAGADELDSEVAEVKPIRHNLRLDKQLAVFGWIVLNLSSMDERLSQKSFVS